MAVFFCALVSLPRRCPGFLYKQTEDVFGVSQEVAGKLCCVFSPLSRIYSTAGSVYATGAPSDPFNLPHLYNQQEGRWSAHCQHRVVAITITCLDQVM